MKFENFKERILTQKSIRSKFCMQNSEIRQKTSIFLIQMCLFAVKRKKVSRKKCKTENFGIRKITLTQKII